MRGLRFDPSRLACSPKEQERRGYEVSAQMLRGYLGDGDIFAEVRERGRRDPQLREMFAFASAVLRPHVEQSRPESRQPVPIRRGRRR
jgi:hypothetical protein